MRYKLSKLNLRNPQQSKIKTEQKQMQDTHCYCTLLTVGCSIFLDFFDQTVPYLFDDILLLYVSFSIWAKYLIDWCATLYSICHRLFMIN